MPYPHQAGSRLLAVTVVVATALGVSALAFVPDRVLATSPAAVDPWLRPDTVPMPAANPMTPERVELGKMLFFDPRLSSSNWISCATCHNPSLGWSDGLPTARGDGMKQLGRNSPTIINAAFSPLQMWDGRMPSLEAQALGPMESVDEMNQDPEDIATELSRIAGYRTLFERAYPGEGITPATMAKAIASFERTVISADSPFDRWRRGDETALSDDAKRGFEVFQGKANCTACHSGWNFTDNGFHNIGLDSRDPGRFAVRAVAVLRGAFKTPTLRDIALTAPYMHNGSYATLGEVIEHYDRGGDIKDDLSPNMKPLGLSGEEKAQLEAFMLALTGDMVPVAFPRLPQ